jgi:hypothetical protein
MPAHAMPDHAAVPPRTRTNPTRRVPHPVLIGHAVFRTTPRCHLPPRPLLPCPYVHHPPPLQPQVPPLSFVRFVSASCPLKLRAQVPHGHADGFLPDAIFPDWSAHRPRWRYNGYADFDPARYHALALGAAAEPASARALARLVGAGASGLTAALLHAVGLRRRAAGPGAPHPTPLPPPY